MVDKNRVILNAKRVKKCVPFSKNYQSVDLSQY